MKPEEIQIYREIQKNAEMAVKAIETVSDKVYDEEFGRQLARQTIKYTDIRNKAVNKLLEAKSRPMHAGYVSDMMLKGSIHVNTLLNTSTGHLAELMIQGNNKGITKMYRVLNHSTGMGKDSHSYALELARELMDFEEKSIAVLKKYL